MKLEIERVSTAEYTSRVKSHLANMSDYTEKEPLKTNKIKVAVKNKKDNLFAGLSPINESLRRF